MSGENRHAPIAVVVVPAHNEAAVIGRCLDRLLAGTRPGEFDVLVVASACTDDTAAIARKAGVRVVATATPGKVHALATGDDACRGFPRIYVDADVEIDAGSLRALVTALDEPGVLACAPRPLLDLTGTGPVVRRVHRVHDVLVDPHRALAGVGVYAVSREGHARAFPIPDVISDDEWVHRSFDESERRVVRTACSVVRPPRTVRAHVRRRVRVRSGNRQLAERGRRATHGPMGAAALLGPLREGRLNRLDVLCYLAVMVLDRGLTTWRRIRGEPVDWGTDVASRAAPG